MNEENEDLTPDEVEDIDENPGETPGEAHREGEFDDIRDRLDGIVEMLDSMKATIAMFISNAGGSADVDDEGADLDIELDEIPGVEDFDLSI